MFRVALTMVVVAGVTTSGRQTAPAVGAPDVCAERRDDSRRAYFCEVREEGVTNAASLDIDPGRNGGVNIRGWSRSDIRLRTRVDGYAETDARVREIVSAIRVTTVGGRVRSDGPTTWNDENWSTSFFLDVPNDTPLAINTENGGISIEAFTGTAMMRARNGSITLRDVAGDMRGRAQNGGLRIDLTRDRWSGQGLDVETRNGSVQLAIPAAYSAELETGTINGRVQIDFPMVMHAGRQRLYTTTLGSGGAKIRAVTSNGAVTVRRN